MKSRRFYIGSSFIISLLLISFRLAESTIVVASSLTTMARVSPSYSSASGKSLLPGAKNDIFSTNILTTSILLAPLMAGNSPYAPWIFFSNEIAINYSDGPVILASNPDGTGQLSTDDAIRLEVIHPDGTVAIYEHVYGYPTCGDCVIPTDPVDITNLFQAGTNRVKIDLYDNLTCCWGTWGYYLVGSDFTSVPQLDLPINYWDANSTFSVEALGNRGTNQGRVNSWFDHELPNYGENNVVSVWTGQMYTETPENIWKLNSGNCATGINCYNGHNGIDFQHDGTIAQEPIYPAATGVVMEIHRDWTNANPGLRGKSYGNYILIDHGGGYATFYAHLASVNQDVKIGTIITDTRSTPIGIMGGTGGWAIHLHFGVYYDQNKDGDWAENEVMDPYGWNIFGAAGTTPDPWHIPSPYLWRYPLRARQSVGSIGTSMTSPSNKVTITIPSDTLAAPVILELWDAPAISEPSVPLRSTGQSFWLRILEWSPNPNLKEISTSPVSFSHPIEVAVAYTEEQVQHLKEDLLTVRHWDESRDEWMVLDTTVNTTDNQVVSQTTEVGSFDLQGPLLCPAAIQEPNDTYDSANHIISNDVPITDLFDIVEDEDWFTFHATEAAQYTIKTSNLAIGVNTILQIYDIDGVTLLALDENDRVTESSSLTWQAPLEGTYFVRVTRAGGAPYGCNASYGLIVNSHRSLFLPLVLK